MTAQDPGGLEVRESRAFTDNYIGLLLCLEEKRCAVVDPGDAQPVIAGLHAHPKWTLGDCNLCRSMQV
ncbi:hydroxyacylglutathione hydrolase [Pseudomonas sp. CFII64]|nr:hydroxyacylglutathione hydrolase [Pseudomonas sp. CFII64]